MSGRKKDWAGSKKNRKDQNLEDRKEKPSKAELDELQRIIKKHIWQSTSERSRTKVKYEEDSSDSGNQFARFKSPSQKRKRQTLLPNAPIKERKSDKDATDEDSEKSRD